MTGVVRPSMLSLVQRANWLLAAVCPACEAHNLHGRKPLVELTEGGAYCNACGHVFAVVLPARATV